MTFVLAETTQIAEGFAEDHDLTNWTYLRKHQQLRGEEDSVLFIVGGWEKRTCLLLTGIMKTSILIFKRNNIVEEV